MKNQGLLAIQPKSFKPKTTESRHRLGYNPNLLLDDFQLTRVNQLWVADITYIPLEGKRFAYLAMLMDRCSWTDSPGGYPATSKRASLGRRPSSAAPFIEVAEQCGILLANPLNNICIRHSRSEPEHAIANQHQSGNLLFSKALVGKRHKNC